MSTMHTKKHRSLTVVIVLVLIVLWSSRAQLFLINASPSVPVGLYMAMPMHRTLKRGDLLRFCAPGWIAERGYVPTSRHCSDKSPALLKPVVGVQGDLVEVRNKVVFVRGYNTKAYILAVDSKGKPIPSISNFVVRKNAFFPLSTFHVRSLDGRYFGEISDNKILHRYICLVCLGEIKDPVILGKL